MFSYYQAKISSCDTQITINFKRSLNYSILRGVSFLGIVLFGYLAVFTKPWWWVIFVILVIIFVVVVIVSEKTNKRLNYFRAYKKICENESNSLVYNQFAYENGNEYKDNKHPYINDLDIFGDHSLFHLLNRCHTFSGRNYLAKQLAHSLENKEQILERQKAVQELQTDPDFILHLLTLLSLREQKNIDKGLIPHWITQPKRLHLSKIMWILIHILPFVNIICLMATFIYYPLFTVFLFLILVQGVILNKYSKKIQGIKHDLNLVMDDIVSFDLYAKIIKDKSFQSPLLQQLQQQIFKYQDLVKQLHKMLATFELGDSFFGFFSNAIFFAHVKNAVKLEKWREKNQTLFPFITATIGEWEILISLGMFYINHSTFVFPQFLESNTETMLEAQAMGHPLLLSDNRITNDIHIDHRELLIITGANMAGKSTFLRTVGVNVILARIGAPVCAASMLCVPQMALFTSMRTIDDLGTGISYFYAEALRIKEMLHFIESGKNVLLIVDELFRGTNSNDRLKSSLSFLRKLVYYPKIAALIATHDLGITEMEQENPEKFKNYCFECENINDKLSFDYQLKRGITHSCNAYKLLQKMGVVE
jgi:DNA mismatch repair ATPase MutS